MFLYHGQEDPVIAADVARKSYEELTELGLDFSFEVEPGLVHSLSMPEIQKVAAFLQSVMK